MVNLPCAQPRATAHEKVSKNRPNLILEVCCINKGNNSVQSIVCVCFQIDCFRTIFCNFGGLFLRLRSKSAKTTAVRFLLDLGCQIFLANTYQNWGKCTKQPIIYQMAINYTKCQ
jgi:hypothetical protein